MKKIVLTLIICPFLFFACSKDDSDTSITDSTDTTTENIAEDTSEYSLQKPSSKRGICFNSLSERTIKQFARTSSWAYNWGPATADSTAKAFKNFGIEFVPMAWNANTDFDALTKFYNANPQCKYLLGYNEPNLVNQANMTPAVAAQTWPDVVKYAKLHSLKLVAPAVNYGTLSGYEDPWKWYDEFFSGTYSGCSWSDVCATAIHSYMGYASSHQSFSAAFEKYNIPVWHTEFCSWGDGKPASVAEQASFMCEMINYNEQRENVERYAWFMCDYSKRPTTYPYCNLVYLNELTDLGVLYSNYSTFDKSIVYPQGKYFPAEHFCACSNDVTVELENAANKNLCISAFNSGKYLDYYVDVKSGDNILKIKYKGRQAELKISVNGALCANSQLAAADNWSTASVTFSSPDSGKVLLRLSVDSGRIYIDRLKIN